MPERRQQLVDKIRKSKEYREALVEASTINGLPFQIRAMQAARGWTQEELGRRADMKQAQISYLAAPGYRGYTLKTLWRLAGAFDCGLLVRFVPFSEHIDRLAGLIPDDVNVPSLEDDLGLDWPGFSSFIPMAITANDSFSSQRLATYMGPLTMPQPPSSQSAGAAQDSTSQPAPSRPSSPPPRRRGRPLRGS